MVHYVNCGIEKFARGLAMGWRWMGQAGLIVGWVVDGVRVRGDELTIVINCV